MSGTDPDVVSITVGTSTLSGWQDVRVSRGVENVPPTFDLALTERYPTQAADIVIQPGQPCQVKLGSDTVINGYVDRYMSQVGPDQHQVRISGRGMTQDLIDCSAEFQTFQINNTTLVQLSKKICQPFGIGVSAPDGDSAMMPQFNVILTETPYEIIERVCRWANFLAYEDTNGNLLLAKVGDTNMASGFVMPDGTAGDTGGNVQAGSVSFSTDNRFTEMRAVYLSSAFLNDGSVPASTVSGPGVIPFIPGAAAFDKSFPKRADGNARYRPLLLVSEQTQNLPQLAIQRTQWDMARRTGRSQQVTLTVDSWRDSAGKLWTPNALASLSLPALKLKNLTWLIASVTFERGERGTTAEVTLMPKEAFIPQPDVLLPFDWQVSQSLNNATTPNYQPAPR
jgi:prophage tail gpP-like protein